MATTAKEIVRTVDLSNDWFANVWSDGSLTIRNCEKGQRIDIPKQSAETLKAILAKAGA